MSSSSLSVPPPPVPQVDEPYDSVVVGAGAGGMAMAIRLAVRGHKVLVVEKTDRVGGRMGVIEEEGYRCDIGPTILLMIDVFRDLWALTGRNFDEEVPCKRLDPNYRINFEDGSYLDMTTHMQRMIEQIEEIEPGASARFLEFMAKAGDDYRKARKHFVERGFGRKREFFTPTNIARLLSMKAYKSLYGELSRLFQDERLRMAFSFQTMYMGISPYDSPSIYGLLAYTELGEGIWFPEGGYYSVAEAMQGLAEDVGVTFQFNWPASRILSDGSRVRGIKGPDDEVILARNVVANADLPYVYKNLLPKEHAKYPRLESMKSTSSGYMLYLGIDGVYDHLQHHNMYLRDDYKATFDNLFDSFELPEHPSFYICAPTRTDPNLAPEGNDLIFVLVPVSHETPNIDWAASEPAFREQILKLLEERAGLTDLRERIVFERSMTPVDWRQQFNLDRGSAFGLSHDIFQVGWFRPDNKHPDLEGLYFVGASTQPGTGVPMVIISSQLTETRMTQDGRV